MEAVLEYVTCDANGGLHIAFEGGQGPDFVDAVHEACCQRAAALRRRAATLGADHVVHVKVADLGITGEACCGLCAWLAELVPSEDYAVNFYRNGLEDDDVKFLGALAPRRLSLASNCLSTERPPRTDICTLTLDENRLTSEGVRRFARDLADDGLTIGCPK